MFVIPTGKSIFPSMDLKLIILSNAIPNRIFKYNQLDITRTAWLGL